MSRPLTRPGTVAVVSGVNGLVVGIPAGSSAVVPRLTSRENADVISAARTKQIMSGEVSPQAMTEVVTDRENVTKNLAADIAAQIQVDAVPANQIGDGQSELHEPKQVTAKSGRAARARQAAAASAGDDLVGSHGDDEVAKV